MAITSKKGAVKQIECSTLYLDWQRGDKEQLTIDYLLDYRL